MLWWWNKAIYNSSVCQRDNSNRLYRTIRIALGYLEINISPLFTHAGSWIIAIFFAAKSIVPCAKVNHFPKFRAIKSIHGCCSSTSAVASERQLARMHLISVEIACFAPITGTQWLDFRLNVPLDTKIGHFGEVLNPSQTLRVILKAIR